ncbi:unnamed protein product [Prorocentrum cordatum]|uniref:aspartyl aminopeptidase n=1 Tax=Prorocentrum cordatum TaxID=2364126 RepID=A0ABN9W2S5_9DINO|nr:unnamed protein product [Polarella glacialis]
MLAFWPPLQGVEEDVVWVAGSEGAGEGGEEAVLELVVRDSRKPGRAAAPDLWVVRSTSAYALRELAPASLSSDAGPALRRRAQSARGDAGSLREAARRGRPAAALHASVFPWDHARPMRQVAAGGAAFSLDAGRRLGACGDFFAAGVGRAPLEGVEAAAVSGWQLGEALGELLLQTTGRLGSPRRSAAWEKARRELPTRPSSKVPAKAGTVQLGVDTYGGGLWHTWFDRPLGLAGKVLVGSGNGMSERLVHIPEPLCIIPNLAIHLTTAEERKAFDFNKETQLRPVLCSALPSREAAPAEGGDSGEKKDDGKKGGERHHRTLLDEVAKAAGVEPEAILDVDLCLMDATPPCVLGDYVSTPRIDNVLSTWAAFDGLSRRVVARSHLATCAWRRLLTTRRSAASPPRARTRRSSSGG